MTQPVCAVCGDLWHAPALFCRNPRPADDQEPAWEAEFLSAEEIQALVRAVLSDGRKVTEQEIERVVDWAEQARVNATLLGLVLDKQLGVGFVEGANEPRFWIRDGRAA